jgi:hypothetical protein
MVDTPGSVWDVFRELRPQIPKGAIVAYDETVDFIYPLWRPDLANEVRFVSTLQTYEQWRSESAAIRADYVFARTNARIASQRVSPLAAWVETDPSRFHAVATAPNHGTLYELR